MASAIQVVLQENFPSLGYVGDTVKVSPGYARNFLYKRGIAVPAGTGAGRHFQHLMTALQAKRSKLKQEAQNYAAELQKLSLEFTIKMGEAGKSFGSITSKDIEAKFLELGQTISKKQIRLTENVKAAGEYKVEVKVHSEVVALVSLIVKAIVPEAPKAEEPRGRGRGRGRARTEENADSAPEAAAGSEEA